MVNITDSPPRAPPIKYAAPLGTRWAKEKAAAGGATVFDLPTDPKSIGPWILGECIGKGASGRVKIAKHRRTGQLAAVKILPIAPLVYSRNSLATQHYKYENFRLGVDREITMMKLMNHPNIMRIYDVFEGENELFLVLEYVEGGELFDFLVNRGRLSSQEAQEYFKQIIYGLNYAHTFSIIHRDLKPENILIASLSPPLIKIADWGMAAFAPPTLQLDTSCGSPHYASPEIVKGEKYQGNATDIWSCGVILYALLTGTLPFDDKNVRTLLSKVKSGKYKMPAWIDPLAKDLLSRMLVVEVAKRITIPEIMAHPWLKATIRSPQTKERSNERLLRQRTPPLPPSPSTLARPIASPSLIDPELFSSLRIIWGKYADAAGEIIKRDLCACAGQGVYAKAFYYLLGNYREESYRKRLVDGEEAYDVIEYNGVRKLRFDRGWRKSDAKMVSSDPMGTSAIPVIPPRNVFNTVYSNENPRQLSVLPLPIKRSGGHGPSKERPTLPAGPRPIPLSQQVPCKVAEHHRLHGAQLVGSARPASPHLIPARRVTLGSRPPPPRRGYTFSHRVEEDIAVEEKPVEGRRNTVVSIAPLSGQRTTVRPSHVPPLTFQGNGSPVLPWLSPELRSPRPLAHVQTKERHLNATSSLGNPLSVPKSSNATHARTQLSPKPQINYNRIQDTHIQWQVRQDPESREKKLPQISAFQGTDKENQDISTEKPTAASGVRRVSGVGLGMGIGNTREVCREMGNVVYIGTGNTPVTKVKKERKGKPPALDLPMRRTPLSALESPVILPSPIVASTDVGSPNRLLTSPVVGEFKGWFSSLFNWKHNTNGNNTLYSPDDMSKSCGDVGRLLEALGVIVVLEKPGEDRSSNLSMTARLKCRVEELTVDPKTNTSLKPVRFRVEFTPIQQTGPLIRHSFWSPPLSPITDNACFFLPPNNEDCAVNGGGNHLLTMPLLSAPNPGLTPRIRMSMLPAVMRTPSSEQNTPMPSPGLNELQMNADLGASGNDSGGSGVPFGTLCGILLVYEKGSTSSFKTIWRRLKDAYCGFPTKTPALPSLTEFEAFSPIMASTPTAQACPKGQFMNTGC